MLDVAVVGAGPAGLAVAIDAARRGLSVAVFERSAGAPDKACGEGIMPPGVEALERLGVRGRLQPCECRPFRSIRYVDVDGTSAEGSLPGEALAVRRVALVRAMVERGREVGADIRFGCGLISHRRLASEVLLETERGVEKARMLIAADGLASRLRREEGLECRVRGVPRFGLRRHYGAVPWSSSVEVHLAEGAEAYVTPISDASLGVAFLWADAPGASVPSSEPPWQRLERKFPALMSRLGSATPQSRIRGAGPFERASTARTRDRFALVGDAAGYVDAITGEGISLSLLSGLSLARVLPEALQRGADRASLARYERDFAHLFRSYSLLTRSVLAISRRPLLRRSTLLVLRRFPRLFDGLLSFFA